MSNLRTKTQDMVDALHERLKDCRLAMLIDQETGLVLCKSSASPGSQNQIEQIAEEALAEIRASSATGFRASASLPELLLITRIRKADVLVFLQDLCRGEDALVCQFNSQPNRTYLMEVASEIFGLPTIMEVA